MPKAKTLIEEVVALKKAIPFTRYNKDTAHKAGMAAGKYPQKTCSHILKLLKSAEANAQFKGLSTASLVIKHVSAQQGPAVTRSGRQQRDAKRTHIELVLEEVKKQDGKK